MATLSGRPKSRVKKSTTTKPGKSTKNVATPRRPLPVEAPDRGEQFREREAPEVRELRRSEAPDAGFGASVELEN